MLLFSVAVVLAYAGKVQLKKATAARVDHFALAQEHHRAGHYDQAISEYQIDLRENPASYFSHYNLAMIYSGQNRFADSRAEYEEALKYKSDFLDAHLGLGLLYHQSLINFNSHPDSVKRCFIEV